MTMSQVLQIMLELGLTHAQKTSALQEFGKQGLDDHVVASVILGLGLKAEQEERLLELLGGSSGRSDAQEFQKKVDTLLGLPDSTPIPSRPPAKTGAGAQQKSKGQQKARRQSAAGSGSSAGTAPPTPNPASGAGTQPTTPTPRPTSSGNP